MKASFILCALVLLVGCASGGTKIDMTQVPKIQKGVTTRAECERIFGAPNSVSTLPDGTSYAMWFHVEAKSHAANFIPVYGMINSQVDTNSDMVQIFFDPAGLVTSVTTHSSNSGMQMGLAH